MLVLKLKGIKKEFSKSPIAYKQIRNEDVHKPKGRFFEQNTIQTFTVLDSTITEIGLNKDARKLLLFIHGGAFISGPAQHHWDTLKEMAKRSDYKIWMCDYPKAPENQISKISENIDFIYFSALQNYAANQISIIGDSVGATLITALMQRLVLKKVELPSRIILVSPVMDSSLTNPEIKALDKVDPILSKRGVLSAKKMCAGKTDLKDPIISPLYGKFKGFPSTTLFLAQNDIMYPDGKLAEIKMKKSHVNIEVIEGNGMPHIWPFLPVMKEAKTALNKIIETINANDIRS
jgi:acetyl esterase/lipase